MKANRRVVVRGGGANLYKVSWSDGWYWVYQIQVKLIVNSERLVGKCKSMDDALTMIRSDSGRAILEVS